MFAQHHDSARPETARHRLLRPGLGHDGRRRLARHHGRLAAARWRTRDDSRLRHRRRGVAADRLGLRQDGSGHARRCWRGRLHRSGLPPIRQLRDRLDDASCLLHRLPVGGRRRRPHRRLHFSCDRFGGALPHRRTPRLSSAPAHWTWTHSAAHSSELQRSPSERNLSELDQLRNDRSVHPVCRFRSRPRLTAKLSAPLHPHSAGIDSAGSSNRPVFHDRIRIRR